ncbi:hypothetical protein [Agromyces humi]|uniref:hypothetical protein n=1 Tax=Agromyces humi TaxID=1766800 RepID=UPI00135CBB93|nr:hypothetical protein [Agromyces humi]
MEMQQVDAAALVGMVNQRLANNGTEFLSASEMPVGPFGTSVFGTIKGRPVRLDFVINPENDRRAVHLFDVRTKQPLAERLMAATFEEAIDDYPWTATIAALVLT